MQKNVGIVDEKRIKEKPDRVNKEIIQGYQNLPDMAGVVARVLDQMGIRGAIPSTILTPARSNSKVVGEAITVRNVPEKRVPYHYWQQGKMTRLGEREAFFLAEDGDIIVIEGYSIYPASCLGSMSVNLAARLGVGAIIVDGAITGFDGIHTAGIPVWSRGGTTITGHHRAETIEINGVIAICGIRVEPGDIVVADGSGVTMVPKEMAEDVLEKAKHLLGLGSKIREMIENNAGKEDLRQELAKQMRALSESKKRGYS